MGQKPGGFRGKSEVAFDARPAGYSAELQRITNAHGASRTGRRPVSLIRRVETIERALSSTVRVDSVARNEGHSAVSRHQRLGATIAKDSGVVLPGASMSRQMGTKDGDKHVKFAWIGGGEGPYSPANEALGAALLELMGIERPMRWVVQVPDGLAAATPEFASLRSKFGLGTDWLPEWGIELTDGQIVAAAAGAPLDELLAQHAVMTWVQVGDHSHNFVQYDKRVIAVDFASGPPTAVWDGGSLGTDVTDHAGLSSLLAAASEETRSAITDRFDAITVADLQEILDELPESWVTRDQCNHVGSELLRTKGATRVVLEP